MRENESWKKMERERNEKESRYFSLHIVFDGINNYVEPIFSGRCFSFLSLLLIVSGRRRRRMKEEKHEMEGEPGKVIQW